MHKYVTNRGAALPNGRRRLIINCLRGSDACRRQGTLATIAVGLNLAVQNPAELVRATNIIAIDPNLRHRNRGLGTNEGFDPGKHFVP